MTTEVVKPTAATAPYEIEILPVVVAGEPNAHLVKFKVGVQSFAIGREYLESRKHAEWFAQQFRHAIHAVVANTVNHETGLTARQLTEQRTDLLTLAHQYASECGECAGTRIVPGDNEGDPDEQCTECTDIWNVIDKAEGRS